MKNLINLIYCNEKKNTLYKWWHFLKLFSVSLRVRLNLNLIHYCISTLQSSEAVNRMVNGSALLAFLKIILIFIVLKFSNLKINFLWQPHIQPGEIIYHVENQFILTSRWKSYWYTGYTTCLKSCCQESWGDNRWDISIEMEPAGTTDNCRLSVRSWEVQTKNLVGTAQRLTSDSLFGRLESTHVRVMI